MISGHRATKLIAGSLVMSSVHMMEDNTGEWIKYIKIII